MDDVTLFGNDGDYLILEALDGQKFRLLSDETLKLAVKKDTPKTLDSNSLTPREIQDQIRNGFSIDEIASAAGASFDFVEKFAAPVIDELAHMVDSAKSVRITTSQDRYSDSTHVEFGELVETRLGHSGASGFSWKAKRGDFNSWNVSVHFSLAGEDSHAAWSFDPRKLTLSPENESAVNLSTNDPLSSTPIPKLRPVLHAEPDVQVNEVEPAQTKDSSSWITQLIPVAEPEPLVELDAVSESSPPLSATADLLQALRIKRGEREAAAELASHGAELPVVDEEPSGVSAPVEPQAAPISKKGRAAMPSWDQIVFGTKTDD